RTTCPRVHCTGESRGEWLRPRQVMVLFEIVKLGPQLCRLVVRGAERTSGQPSFTGIRLISPRLVHKTARHSSQRGCVQPFPQSLTKCFCHQQVALPVDTAHGATSIGEGGLVVDALHIVQRGEHIYDTIEHASDSSGARFDLLARAVGLSLEFPIALCPPRMGLAVGASMACVPLHTRTQALYPFEPLIACHTRGVGI